LPVLPVVGHGTATINSAFGSIGFRIGLDLAVTRHGILNALQEER
jgi:hypothetical protein